MAGGRPRKPSKLRELEGNRSRTDIPPELPLHGVPECPAHLADESREHFNFIAAEMTAAGVTKRIDTPALAILADLWRNYWRCSEHGDLKTANAIAARWESFASKFGLTPVDRAKLMAGVPKEEAKDDIADRFFKVTG